MDDNHPTSEAHLDQCCDICGDIGVSDALSICPHCKVSCEHLYCMRICQQYEPEDWCCDECEQMNEILPHNSAQPNNLPNDPRRNLMDREKKIHPRQTKPLSAEEAIMLASGNITSSIPLKLTFRSGPVFQKNAASLHNDVPVKSGAVPAKSLLHHPVRANSSLAPSKHLKSLRHTNSQMNAVSQQQVAHSFKERRERDAIRARLKEHSQNGFKNTEQRRLKKAICETACASSPSTHGPLSDNSERVAIRAPSKDQSKNAVKDTAQIRVEKAISKTASVSSQSTYGQPIAYLERDAIQAPMKEHMQKEQSKNAFKDIVQIRVEKLISKTASACLPWTHGQPIANSGAGSCHDLKLQRTDHETVNPSNNIIAGVRKCLADPASDASWKGSFEVFNALKQGEISDEIQAYPPSRVLRKVYEFSKLMPEVLQFELVPRGDLWVKLFQKYSPDRRDVGLYFFPTNRERSENYFSLLEFMGAQDLAMRKQMNGVNLLLFTSKLLQIDCQKWKGRDFLWGVYHRVYKAKHASQVDEHECHVGWDNNEVVDMDIDMMAGEDVGRMDIAVSRESLELPASIVTREPCDDIPPGFENTYKLRTPISSSSVNNIGHSAAIKIERFDEDRNPNVHGRNEGTLTPIASQRLDAGSLQSPLMTVKPELC